MQNLSVIGVGSHPDPYSLLIPEHPNLCKYVDFGKLTENSIFFVSTDSEDSEMSRADNWREFAVDVLSGLSVLHAHGIFHGNLNFDGLRVGKDGRVRLFGWGIKKCQSEKSDLEALANLIDKYYGRQSSNVVSDFVTLCRSGESSGSLLTWPGFDGVSRLVGNWIPKGVSDFLPSKVAHYFDAEKGTLKSLKKFGVTRNFAYKWWVLAGGDIWQLFERNNVQLIKPAEFKIPIFSSDNIKVPFIAPSQDPSRLIALVVCKLPLYDLEIRLQTVTDGSANPAELERLLSLATEYQIFRGLLRGKKEKRFPRIYRDQEWTNLLGIDHRIPEWKDLLDLNDPSTHDTKIKSIFAEIIREPEKVDFCLRRFKALLKSDEECVDSVQKAVRCARINGFIDIYPRRDILTIWDLIISDPKNIQIFENLIVEVMRNNLKSLEQVSVDSIINATSAFLPITAACKEINRLNKLQ